MAANQFNSSSMRESDFALVICALLLGLALGLMLGEVAGRQQQRYEDAMKVSHDR